jgi:hypothetical protein
MHVPSENKPCRYIQLSTLWSCGECETPIVGFPSHHLARGRELNRTRLSQPETD